MPWWKKERKIVKDPNSWRRPPFPRTPPERCLVMVMLDYVPSSSSDYFSFVLSPLPSSRVQETPKVKHTSASRAG